MGVEKFAEFVDHGRGNREAFGGREGAAAQTAAEGIPVEYLVIWRVALRESAQESRDAVGVGIGVFHVFVVDAEALENAFIVAGESGFFHAPIVPGDDHPSAGLDDATKLAAGCIGFEPVEGLSGGD